MQLRSHPARTILGGFAVLLLALAAGCSHQPLPGMRLEPVTTFSLGTAKFTPFKTRPTAEQLRAAAVRLYDSFDTAAATVKSHDQLLKSEETQDYRAAKPDKELIAGTLVMARNGEYGFMYAPRKGRYILWPPAPDGHLMPVAGWLGLTHGPFSSVKLLPDQNIGGTEVYVLELRRLAKREKYGRTLIYLGKNDLLPRRREIMQEANFAQGQPGDTITKDFLGFVANSKLPDDLFPKEPPKGAKPAEGGILVED